MHAILSGDFFPLGHFVVRDKRENVKLANQRFVFEYARKELARGLG